MLFPAGSLLEEFIGIALSTHGVSYTLRYISPLFSFFFFRYNERVLTFLVVMVLFSNKFSGEMKVCLA